MFIVKHQLKWEMPHFLLTVAWDNSLCAAITERGNLFLLDISYSLSLSHLHLCIRPQYFKIIEECVSQIVLHRSGTDPDFSYRKRLDVDFSHLLGKWSSLYLAAVFSLISNWIFNYLKKGILYLFYWFVCFGCRGLCGQSPTWWIRTKGFWTGTEGKFE